MNVKLNKNRREEKKVSKKFIEYQRYNTRTNIEKSASIPLQQEIS
jgi:hypothetical protein